MKYIEKTVTSISGHDNTCWVPACANVDLIQNKFHMILSGYKDADSKTANLPAMEAKPVSIPLTELPSWNALWNEVMNYAVTVDPTFIHGVIKDLPE